MAPTCLTCHPSTPEDCSVCHGSSANPAPPRDIDDHTATTFTGVGAHQAHLSDTGVTDGVDCAECHVVPERFGDLRHADSELPAEVTFGALAAGDGAEPVWNGQTCGNTYCHGAAEPAWTKVGQGEAACGTCHGTPPPSPHPQVQACSRCHPRVADDNLNILNRALHINGSVEVGS